MSSRAFAYRRAAERRLIYALVIVLAAMIMLPFVWLVLMSFKTNDDIFAFPPKLLFTPTLENYVGLWASSFRYSFLNSAVVSVTSTLLALLVGVPGAYALSRMSMRQEKPLSLLILASRMAPPIAFTIPYFLAYRWMGLLRHQARPHPHLSHLQHLACRVADALLLRRLPTLAGGGGLGRRGDPMAGLHQHHAADLRARRRRHRHPVLPLQLERLLLRADPDAQPGDDGAGRRRQFHEL